MTSARSLDEGRRFGYGVGGFAVLAGLIALLRGAPWPVVVAATGAGVLLVASGWLAPRILATAARRWFVLAEAVARVGNAIVLGLVFFLLVTPIGIVLRLSGKDLLDTRGRRRSANWRPYPERQADPRHYERLA